MSADKPAAAKQRLDVTIVYDGDCPVCSAYVRMYRLRELASRVDLVNARATDHAVMEEIRRLRLDLDQGMVVKLDGRLYHGADALHVLAILGSGGTILNAFNRLLFRNPRIARAVYPSLVRGRLLLLRMLGRHLIAEA